MHKHKHKHMYMYMYKHKHKHMYMNMYMYMYKHMHMHMHMYMHMLPSPLAGRALRVHCASCAWAPACPTHSRGLVRGEKAEASQQSPRLSPPPFSPWVWLVMRRGIAQSSRPRPYPSVLATRRPSQPPR